MRSAFLCVLLWALQAQAASTTFTGPVTVPLPCSALPALTGDVTNTAGSCATVVGISTTWQVFTSGTAQTYTTPTGVNDIIVQACGGGGGGGGTGATTGPTGTTGTASTFNSINAAGGTGGAGVTGTTPGAGGAGGTGGSGSANLRIPGQAGKAAFTGTPVIIPLGPPGGNGAVFAGYGTGGLGSPVVSISHAAGGGGGGGECLVLVITSPAATYTYTVGGGGAGGIGTGTGAATGGAGTAGIIIVTENK
jgi:hypothetical protein